MATRGGGVLMPKPRQERLSRAAHLTETEKMQLALCYQALPTYPPGTLNAGKKMGVTELEISKGVAPGYIRQHLKIPMLLKYQPDAKPLEQKERSDKGIPRKMTPEVQAAFAEQAKGLAHVDLDEKWWYSIALHTTCKVPPGMPAQHKSHVPKTMFLTAIGRPRFDGDECTFDGKIGCWR